MSVKSRPFFASSPPTRFNALVLLLLSTSSPPSTFLCNLPLSFLIIASLSLLLPQPAPSNNSFLSCFFLVFACQSYISSQPTFLCFLCFVVFPLFLLLFHVHNFFILLPESSLESELFNCQNSGKWHLCFSGELGLVRSHNIPVQEAYRIRKTQTQTCYCI